MTVSPSPRQGIRLRIISKLDDLAVAVGQRVEEQGAASVEQVQTSTDAYEFRHRRDLDPSRIRDLFDAIAPLRPVIRPQEKLSTDADAELYFGMDGDWDQWRLKVYADSERASGRAREVLQSLSFEDVGNKLLMVEQNKLCYGGAPPIVRHALQWWLARELGVTVELHKQWGDDDHDLWLYLRDPEHEGKPLAACFSINVTTDDLESGQALIDHLETLGFRRGHLQLEAFDSERAGRPSISALDRSSASAPAPTSTTYATASSRLCSARASTSATSRLRWVTSARASRLSSSCRSVCIAAASCVLTPRGIRRASTWPSTPTTPSA